MHRRLTATGLERDLGGSQRRVIGRRGLRLVTPAGDLNGPEKYRLLELKRRRAQIRARRELGLG